MSTDPHNPATGYVLIFWCRGCGHVRARPLVNHSRTLAEHARRASCGKCGGRNIGVQSAYELRLPGPDGFFIWELKLIATACTEAAERARIQSDAIPYSVADQYRKQALTNVAMAYGRLAGYYRAQVHEREAMPMHVAPTASNGKE